MVITFQSGELSFIDIPELTTAFRACGGELGEDHELTSGLRQIMGKVSCQQDVLDWVVDQEYVYLLYGALKSHIDKFSTNTWEHAEIATMLDIKIPPWEHSEDKYPFGVEVPGEQSLQ